MKKLLFTIFALTFIVACTSLLLMPASARSEDTVAVRVWKSEEAYLSGEEAIFENNSPELSSDVISKGDYVRCYADVKLAENLSIAVGRDVVIDLGGNALSCDKSIDIGTSSSHGHVSLTVRNGALHHLGAQLFKTRVNSKLYLESLDIRIKGTWGAFVYSTAFRTIVLRDSTLTIESNLAQVFYSTPLPENMISKVFAADGEGAREYEQNIVFDNSHLIDNRPEGTTGYIFKNTHADGGVSHVEISFLRGSSFNRLGEYTVSNLNTSEGAYFNINISKGVKFKEREIPIGTLDPSVNVNYYNSLSLENYYLVRGEETSVASEEGEENGVSHLIFGISGDPELPYALGNYLCNVTWYDNFGEVIERGEGYADGVLASHTAPSRGYYVNEEDGLIYLEMHVGWRPSVDSSEAMQRIEVTERESGFYAEFVSDGPAALVEYSSENMSSDGIKSIVMNNVITEDDLDGLSDGSYVRLYSDIVLGNDFTVEVTGDITLDLAGFSIMRGQAVNEYKSAFSVRGGSLELRNGQIGVSMSSLAELADGGVLSLSGVSATYDISPLVRCMSGEVIVRSSIISSSADLADAPMLLKLGEEKATVKLSECEVYSQADLIMSNAESTEISLELLTGCVTDVRSLVRTLCDNVSVSAYVDGALVGADKIFDTGESASPTLTVISGSFTRDPEDIGCGTLVLPNGGFVVEKDESDYRYTVKTAALVYKFNMEISLSLKMNFYIPESTELISASTYLGTMRADELAVSEIDGVRYYTVSITGISARDAFDSASVTVKYLDADGDTATRLIEYDPYDYFAELLSSDDMLDRRLAAAALEYISRAYEYSDTDLPEKMVNLRQSDEYTALLRGAEDIPTGFKSAERGNIGDAFRGAQLYLSSEIAIRFNIADGFTGTLNIGGEAYAVSNGSCAGLGYIDVPVSAVDLYRGVVRIEGVKDSGTVIDGEYSLEEYIRAMADTDEELAHMLSGLLAYCYEAYVYVGGGVLPPFTPDTPVTRVEFE